MLHDHLKAAIGDIGAIIHIGAGFCSELPVYQAAAPDKILLVEPNPDTLATLRRDIKDLDKVELLPMAVSNTPNQAPLNVLNFADLSSLNKPSGLLELLPGVRILSKPLVDTITLKSLCERLPEELHKKKNWLVIDAPGLELEIVQALAHGDLPVVFDKLVIRCSVRALYKGGADAKQVLAELTGCGYREVQSNLDDDPDWPMFLLHRDTIAIENMRLEAELAAAKKAKFTVDEHLENLTTQVQGDTEKATARATELQNKVALQDTKISAQEDSLTAQKTDIADAQKKIAWLREKVVFYQEQHELDQSIKSDVKQKLKAALENVEKAESASSETLLAMKGQLSQQTNDIEAAQKMIRQGTETEEELHAKLLWNREEIEKQQLKSSDAKDALKAKLTAQIAKTTATKEDLQETNITNQRLVDQLRDQDTNLHNDLRVALQMQMQSRADLRALQARFDTLKNEKTQQEDVLIRLSQQLGNTSEPAPTPAQPETPANRASVEQIERPDTDQETQLFYFPDQTASNPYQTLAYANMAHMNAQAGTVEDALSALAENDNAQRVVLHLHWLKPILAGAKNVTEAEEKRQQFRKKLARFAERGGIVLWTVHEAVAKRAKHAKTLRGLGQDVADLAARVHLHSASLVAELAESYTLDPAKLLISPHPAYINHYRNYVTQDAARRYLGINQNARLFLFFGRLAPQKGLDQLVQDFAQIHQEYPDAHLLIVGAPVFPYTSGAMQRKFRDQPNVQVIEGHVADENLQWYFNAAEWVVLPDTDALAPGPALCALGFSRPVIASAQGIIPELIQSGVNGFTFVPAQSAGLINCMRQALKTKPHARGAFYAAAFETAKPLTWDTLQRALQAGIQTNKAFASVDISFEDGTKKCTIIGPDFPPKEVAQTAVIILNYGHIDDSRRLVRSLRESSLLDFDIYIVDNCSPNINNFDLAANFNGITVLRTPANLGYAAGNNAAMRLMQDLDYEFLWILNPDMSVSPDALQQHVDAAKTHPDHSIFGPVLLQGADQNRIASAGSQITFQGGLKTGHLRAKDKLTSLPKTPYEVDFITGAAIFMRKAVLEKIGFIPECYFLYFEETEWLLHASKAGEKCLVLPNIRLTHYKRSEDNGLPAKYYLYYYVRNALLFCTRMGEADLSPTITLLRKKFIANALRRVAKATPKAMQLFEALAEQALLDGQAGKTGAIDLEALEAVILARG